MKHRLYLKIKILFAVLFFAVSVFASDGVLQVGFSCESMMAVGTRASSLDYLFIQDRAMVETPRLLLAKGEIVDQVLVFERTSGLRLGHLSFQGEGHEIALFFEPYAKGQGFGTEAKFALMKYVFEKWGFDYQVVKIDPSHVASIKLHQKLGFLPAGEIKGDFLLTASQFKALENRVAEEFNGDLVDFSKPSHAPSIAQQIAFDYLEIIHRNNFVDLSSEERFWNFDTTGIDSEIELQVMTLLGDFSSRVTRLSYVVVRQVETEDLAFIMDVKLSIETPRLRLSRLAGSTIVEVFEKKTGLKVGELRLSRGGKRLPIQMEPFAHRAGYGTEAKFFVMQFAFNELGVEEIAARINFKNKASIKLHEKLGFILVGEKYGIGTFKITKDQFRTLERHIVERFSNDISVFARPSYQRSSEERLAYTYTKDFRQQKTGDISMVVWREVKGFMDLTKATQNRILALLPEDVKSQFLELMPIVLQEANQLPSQESVIIETPRLVLSQKEGSAYVHVFEKEPGLYIGHFLMADNQLPLGFEIFSRGVGFATEAIYFLIKHAFETLGWDQVNAAILTTNVGSLRLHKKLGFVPASKASDNMRYVITPDAFLKIEQRVESEFGGDVIAFSIPRRQRPLDIFLAYEYVKIFAKADSRVFSLAEQEWVAAFLKRGRDMQIAIISKLSKVHLMRLLKAITAVESQASAPLDTSITKEIQRMVEGEAD